MLAGVAVVVLDFTCSLSTAYADSIGEALYRRGVLPSGQPLTGTREGNATVEGRDAACVNCHRRSGLGSTEGRITIPPIAAPYLYRPGAQRIDDEAVPYVGSSRVAHQAYTDETLTRAIREGVGADGRPLSYLMPRYAIDDAAMSELRSYLTGLTPRRVPGVTDTVLHFATIITPDADAIRREGMLSVLEQYFADKNAVARSTAPRLYASRPMMFRVTRKWQLHVWTLSGAPQTWEAQLRARLAAEPVLAVISGLGGKTWEPVHRFCQAESLPCLFPNLEVPVVSTGDFYSVYFSKGVLLEAQLIARQIGEVHAKRPPRRVVQVFRMGDVGEEAAAALQAASQGAGLQIENRALRRDGGSSELRAALSHVAAGDALVLWLRGPDLQALAAVPVNTLAVWMSGLMGGLENAPLPAAWREATHMAYPFDLPDASRVRVDYALGWFKLRKINVVVPQVQVDTYLACGLLAETLSHMVETFQRDYLIERLDDMVEHRVLTGYYPRLTLGTGQSFASKGGYLVHFVDPTGTRLAADGEWIAP